MKLSTSTTREKNLILYFQVHQPERLRSLQFLDIGTNQTYFDDDLNREIVQRVAKQCYMPTNRLLLKLIRQNPGIKASFSISGVTIDQLEKNAPEVLASFRALADTGSVEFLCETYYHSLACMIPGNEFELQAAKHQRQVLRHFGVLPTVFRNTELIYNDQLGTRIADIGYRGVFVEGVDSILGHNSPHQLFKHPSADLKLLARSYNLSDDISFRFSQNGRTLSVEQYVSWLKAMPQDEDMITLAMDYETFGEHQGRDKGIFDFLEKLLLTLNGDTDFSFRTPSEAIRETRARTLSSPNFVSWADQERDLSAWLGNEMQRDAFDTLIRLEKDVKNLHNKALLHLWRSMQTSDHFYYMSTKRGSDGAVHAYFSPYASPYEAFINYMNILADLGLKIKAHKAAAPVAESESLYHDVDAVNRQRVTC